MFEKSMAWFPTLTDHLQSGVIHPSSIGRLSVDGSEIPFPTTVSMYKTLTSKINNVLKLIRLMVQKSQTTTWDILDLVNKWDFNYQPQLVSLQDFWTINSFTNVKPHPPMSHVLSIPRFFSGFYGSKVSKVTMGSIGLVYTCLLNYHRNQIEISFPMVIDIFISIYCFHGKYIIHWSYGKLFCFGWFLLARKMG